MYMDSDNMEFADTGRSARPSVDVRRMAVIAAMSCLAAVCAVPAVNAASRQADPADDASQAAPSADSIFDAYLDADRAAIAVWRERRDEADTVDELAHRAARDQRVRRVILDLLTTPGAGPDQAQWTWLRLVQRMNGIDRENAAWLKDQLETLDWFTLSEFGEEADNNAFLIVQHATHDPGFMRDVHARFERLWPEGEIAPDNYALLTDRLAVIDGAPQPYGSQFECVDGEQRLQTPLADAEAIVDARRAEVGLPPLAEYRALLPDCGSLPSAG
jgi:hypothetical protein